ncbi:MAG TPA: membrane protein insertion efficiency factor YidD [bacterium]|nr:membrane protein insertion efficiency factor YidD [bacterium]
MMSRILVALVRGYQRFVSPYTPPTCRFSPSCSAYAVEAIQRHGPWRGVVLATRRLLRCHPFHPGGYDPVP